MVVPAFTWTLLWAIANSIPQAGRPVHWLIWSWLPVNCCLLWAIPDSNLYIYTYRVCHSKLLNILCEMIENAIVHILLMVYNTLLALKMWQLWLKIPREMEVFWGKRIYLKLSASPYDLSIHVPTYKTCFDLQMVRVPEWTIGSAVWCIWVCQPNYERVLNLSATSPGWCWLEAVAGYRILGTTFLLTSGCWQ